MRSLGAVVEPVLRTRTPVGEVSAGGLLTRFFLLCHELMFVTEERAAEKNDFS
jgi:hypothetical protein